MSSTSHQDSVQDGKYNFGSWNEQETLKYLVFLDENKIIMSSKLKKKKFRVFDQMSTFVKTRSSLQCRSHHQKATQKYKEIKVIIVHQKLQIPGIDYKTMFKQLRDEGRVKQDYQNIPSTHQIQQNISEIQEKKLVNNSINQVYSPSVVTNFFPPINNCYGMIPPQIFDFFPIEQAFYYPSMCMYSQYQTM